MQNEKYLYLHVILPVGSKIPNEGIRIPSLPEGEGKLIPDKRQKEVRAWEEVGKTP